MSARFLVAADTCLAFVTVDEEGAIVEKLHDAYPPYASVTWDDERLYALCGSPGEQRLVFLQRGRTTRDFRARVDEGVDLCLERDSLAIADFSAGRLARIPSSGRVKWEYEAIDGLPLRVKAAIDGVSVLRWLEGEKYVDDCRVGRQVVDFWAVRGTFAGTLSADGALARQVGSPGTLGEGEFTALSVPGRTIWGARSSNSDGRHLVRLPRAGASLDLGRINCLRLAGPDFSHPGAGKPPL